VIKALRSKNGKVRIVIAETVPAKGREDVSGLLNDRISVLARSSASPLQPVVVADMDWEFANHQDLGKDELLPGEAGSRKIAAILAEAIDSLLSPVRHHPPGQ
jgi:hypothetical protein